jgi:hypothetical protein
VGRPTGITIENTRPLSGATQRRFFDCPLYPLTKRSNSTILLPSRSLVKITIHPWTKVMYGSIIGLIALIISTLIGNQLDMLRYVTIFWVVWNGAIQLKSLFDNIKIAMPYGTGPLLLALLGWSMKTLFITLAILVICLSYKTATSPHEINLWILIPGIIFLYLSAETEAGASIATKES